MSRDGQLVKREEGGTSGLTIAKWGLMGVGAIVVAGWVFSLLSWAMPILVLGGVGWVLWKVFGSRSGPPANRQLPPGQVNIDGGQLHHNRNELDEFDRRLAEAEAEVERTRR